MYIVLQDDFDLVIAITLAQIVKGKDTDVILAKENVIQRIVQVKVSKKLAENIALLRKHRVNLNLYWRA